jgi:XTP/dITP diphosphohydrolase
MKSNKAPPSKVVLASGNQGKLAEFAELLKQWHCEVLPQSLFATPEAAETGDSFVENALLKAHNAAQHTNLPAIADDSGLEVDALDGAPGIFSARYAGANATDEDNNRKLLAALAGLPKEQRSARFRCVLVYLRHWQDPNPIICEGSWEGLIIEQPRGQQGFGYDPLFFIEAQGCTSAELPRDVKNQLSHRGQAMARLLAELQQEYL